MNYITFTPLDFVASVNQILETAFPLVAVEGELSQFRLTRNRWVYFNLKDELANVPCFGTVYQLPGTLQDGLMLRAIGAPRLHPRFGFSLNIQSIQPVGEGSLKKAADLLRTKLEAEGLFAPERKRPLPPVPKYVGLITAADSAAANDFWKVLNDRWVGVEVSLADVAVQGEQAPLQIIAAIEAFSSLAEPPEVLVITRGGGSADDLAAFNDERVVRAVAVSRIPTLIAIGHEIDVSLAELAADRRASTPTHAAFELVPDKKPVMDSLEQVREIIQKRLQTKLESAGSSLEQTATVLRDSVKAILDWQNKRLADAGKILELLSPQATLRRGYALLHGPAGLIISVSQAKPGQIIEARLSDGTIRSEVKEISNS